MQIKKNLLHALRHACKNEFSQNEIKLSTSLGNNNKVVNEQETGRSIQVSESFEYFCMQF